MSSSLLRSRGSAAAGGCSSLLVGLLGCSNHFDNHRAMIVSTIKNSAVDVEKSGVSPPPPPPPWLMQPPTFNKSGSVMSYNFYHLAEEKQVSVPINTRIESEKLPNDEYKFVGSSHGWLALLNPRNNHLFLSNPITGRQINLPDPETKFLGIVTKLILTCSPDDDQEDEECRAVMIFGPEDRLAFCHPQRRSAAWTPLGDLFFDDERYVTFTRRCRDIVFSSTHKLLFCVFETLVALECWDIRDPVPRKRWSRWLTCLENEREAPLFSEGVWIQQCLVFQANRLFVVNRRVISRTRPDGSYPIPIYFSKYRGWDHNRFPYQTIAFNVHQLVDNWDDDVDDLGDEGRTLDSVFMKSSLDGLAMFIGMNHSFAIAADEFPELKLKPDCIYFTDTNRHPKPASLLHGGHDIGIFHYGNRTFSPCVYPRQVKDIERIVPAPMWFTPSPY